MMNSAISGQQRRPSLPLHEQSASKNEQDTETSNLQPILVPSIPLNNSGTTQYCARQATKRSFVYGCIATIATSHGDTETEVLNTDNKKRKMANSEESEGNEDHHSSAVGEPLSQPPMDADGRSGAETKSTAVMECQSKVLINANYQSASSVDGEPMMQIPMDADGRSGESSGADTKSSTVMENQSCDPGMDIKPKENFTPRQYQLELLESALDHNTIVCLQTGTGKTFIGVMLIKEMAHEIRKDYDKGGKRTIFLVNTVPLVSQQASVIKMHTDLSVGEYVGAMNVDLWDGNKWEQEFQKHQVLVMTAQIFLDILHHGFMGLAKVNLLIFDECHHAVKYHPYREIMKVYDVCPEEEYPRVLGLTASILSSKCDPDDFEKNLMSLEKTMRCTAETTCDLNSMKIHGTKPKEVVMKCAPYVNDSDVFVDLLTILQDADHFIRDSQLMVEDEEKDPRSKVKQVISDCLHVLTTVGPIALNLFIPYTMAELDKDLAVEFLEWPIMFLQYAKTQLRIAQKICEVNSVGLENNNWRNTDMIAPKMKKLLQVLLKFKSHNGDSAEKGESLVSENASLCGVVFVQRRCTAVILDYLLKEIQKFDDDLGFLSSSIVVGAGGVFGMGEELMEREYKKQEAELKKFRKHETNLLFATSVLEEGVDVPKLNLVVRYDLPKAYGSYIQSRGRARASRSHYIMLMDEEQDGDFETDLQNFRDIEKILQAKCHDRDQPDEEDISAHMADTLVPPYMPRIEDGAPRVTLTAAIPLVFRYCSKLPSDRYTQLVPRFKISPVETDDDIQYQAIVSLPTNCPIKDDINGSPMPRRKLAEMSAALETCKRLHQVGELNDHLLPVSHVIVNEEEDILDDELEEDETMIVDGQGKIGTTKRRQLYKKMVSSHLQDRFPIADLPTNHLYKIHMKAAGQCSGDVDANKSGYLENTLQEFGIVSNKPIPKIPTFSLFTKTGELAVSLEEITSELSLTTSEKSQLESFHQCIFTEVLKIGNHEDVLFDITRAEADYLVVPIIKAIIHENIDWNMVKAVNEEAGTFNKLSSSLSKSGKCQASLYQDTVVTPVYRNNDDPPCYFVRSISPDLTVTSTFPGDDQCQTFKDYYKITHGIDIQDLEQSLLCVQQLPTNLNFLVAKNKDGCSDNTEMEIGGSNMKNNGVYLVPELCHIFPFPGSLWHKALFLPSMLHRLNQLLIVQELQKEIIQILKHGTSTNETSYQDADSTSQMILQSLTTTRARESFNLERLEMLGDSFLKFSTTCYLYMTKPSWNEGRLSSARSKMVRNSNLYQLGKKKAIPHMMSVVQFRPKKNWLPPGFHFSGDANDENCTHQWIADKSVADSVEALIGCFLISRGTIDTMHVMTNWLGIKVLPATNEDEDDIEMRTAEMEDCENDGHVSDVHIQNGSISTSSNTIDSPQKDETDEKNINLATYFKTMPSAIISNSRPTNAEEQLAILTQGLDVLEEKINYKFKNKAYLLQALTHSSYHYNHVTECYQRLEYLGDAILDYLITRHLYQLDDHHKLSAGALTDIRSALVCNATLAHWAVEKDLHKYMKSLSPELFYLIEKFVKGVQQDNDDDAVSLHSVATSTSDASQGSEESSSSETEEEEIPKALGDLAESVAGAIFMDSGLSLEAVWGVFYPIMKSQIEMYITNPPMSPVRELLERHPRTVTFSKSDKSEESTDKSIQMTVEVRGIGNFIGCGKNSRLAKINAAKKALKKIKEAKICDPVSPLTPRIELVDHALNNASFTLV